MNNTTIPGAGAAQLIDFAHEKLMAEVTQLHLSNEGLKLNNELLKISIATQNAYLENEKARLDMYLDHEKAKLEQINKGKA